MSFHILEENVKMEGKMNLQDTFLNEARKENAPVSIFLMNGVQLKGKRKSFAADLQACYFYNTKDLIE